MGRHALARPTRPAIIKHAIATTTGDGSTADDGTHLVTYNGLGHATALAEIDARSGVQTVANRVTYSTLIVLLTKKVGVVET